MHDRVGIYPGATWRRRTGKNSGFSDLSRPFSNATVSVCPATQRVFLLPHSVAMVAGFPFLSRQYRVINASDEVIHRLVIMTVNRSSSLNSSILRFKNCSLHQRFCVLSRFIHQHQLSLS